MLEREVIAAYNAECEAAEASKFADEHAEETV
jgi:hypothetical protein